jgi:penicillin-binding protein 2
MRRESPSAAEGRRGVTRAVAVLLGLSLALGACASSPSPSPSPVPTPVPVPPRSEAVQAVRAYLAAWIAGDYAAMYAMLAPQDRARFAESTFVDLHHEFASLTKVTALVANVGDARDTALAPEPPAPFAPSLGSPVQSPSSPGASGAVASASAPAASSPAGGSPDASTPGASAAGASPAGASPSPAGSPAASPTAAATAPALGPAVPGPVPALAFPTTLAFTTDLLGQVRLDRELDVTRGAQRWEIRWTPAFLFPELTADATLTLDRTLGPRGKIVAADGTVFAETRADGMRIYPQESLAGQTIGYVSRVTAADLKTLASQGYELGDWVGRSGLEQGAESLLRGSPGFTLGARIPGRGSVTLLSTPMVPGADLTITLKPTLQRTAEAAMRAYPRVGAAVVNPKNGDVWVLASLPAFDPNAMTLGTTLKGTALARPSGEQITSKAVLGAYPAGSDFKPFTLGAALQTGTVTTTTRMPCPGTWTFQGFLFQNWMHESLAGMRTWTDLMALSCNTAFMPLSVLLYNKSTTALTDLIRTFGFGEKTGIPFLAENPGILPDAAYFERTPRWNGAYSPYGPFDQIQLAIGQGSFLGTPLQLATAYAAWGNRGTLWVPHLVLNATLPDGTVVYQREPTVHSTIPLDRKVMDFVVSTMRAVVTSPLGTAYRALSTFPVAVAGKSGTAETGGPDPDAWFPAFAPMNGPTIAAAVVVVTVPLGNGGDFAAPIVRKIMAAHFFP